MVKENESLAKLFLEAASAWPPSPDQPWRLVIGFDEFAPGNKLNVNNRRKAMVLNYSFLELGHSIRLDACWFTPIVVRSAYIARVRGGWSNMLRQYLHLHLFSPGGLSAGGVLLDINGQPLLLHAKLSNLMSDGDGLRMALDWKGAASLKPCFRHSNVTSKRSGLPEQPGRRAMVDITCSDFRRFETEGPGYVETLMDLVIEAEGQYNAEEISAGRYKQIVSGSGFNPNRLGVLADVELRSHISFGTVSTLDWVHSALQDGTMSTEIYLLIAACEDLGLCSFPELEAFLKTGWCFPSATQHKGKTLYRIFDEYRADAAHRKEKIKGSSSEVLGLYTLLRHWVETKLEHHPELELKRSSFDACCLVVDMILDAKRGAVALRDAVPALRNALAMHMQRHLAAYGRAHVKPKHHWLWDVAEQLVRDPLVLDAFITERLHLRAKDACEPVDNTRQFERSALSGLLRNHKRALSAGIREAGLLGPSRPLADAPHVIVADHMDANGLAVSVGDFVSREGSMGEVVACLAEDQEMFAVLKMTELVQRISPSSVRYRITGRHVVVPATNLEQSVAWYWSGEEVIVLWK